MLQWKIILSFVLSGSRRMTGNDINILLRLRQENPSRSLRDYDEACLFAETGKVVSTTTISIFLRRTASQSKYFYASGISVSLPQARKYYPTN
eukprot:scaffold35278_cov54-Attheya_sp.AAC.4